jgi:hypothetical protein
MVVIAVRGEEDTWVEIELGTGDTEHFIRMLVAARDEAQAALDADLDATLARRERPKP